MKKKARKIVAWEMRGYQAAQVKFRKEVLKLEHLVGKLEKQLGEKTDLIKALEAEIQVLKEKQKKKGWFK